MENCCQWSGLAQSFAVFQPAVHVLHEFLPEHLQEGPYRLWSLIFVAAPVQHMKSAGREAAEENKGGSIGLKPPKSQITGSGLHTPGTATTTVRHAAGRRTLTPIEKGPFPKELQEPVGST